MIRKVTLAILLLFGTGVTTFLQSQEKRALRHTDYDAWNELRNSIISANGRLVCYEKNPQLGDGKLMITDLVSGRSDSVSRGYDAHIAAGSGFIVFRIKPPYQLVRKAKLDKKKTDDQPKDSLGIWFPDRDTILKFSGVKSCLLPDKHGEWLAILKEKEKEKTKQSSSDTLSAADTLHRSAKKKVKPEGSPFLIFNPLTMQKQEYAFVTEYAASNSAGLFCLVQWVEDSLPHYAVHLFHSNTGQDEEIFNATGKLTLPVVADKGDRASFMHASDSSASRGFRLLLWTAETNSCKVIVDTITRELTCGWRVNAGFKPWFSDNSARLFIGIAPLPTPEKKDSLTEDEKYSVDVWHWQDPQIQPQQKLNAEKENKRTWLAEYIIKSGTLLQLGDTLVQEVNVPYRGTGTWAIGYNPQPYRIFTSWKDRLAQDCYLLNLENGKKEKILKAFTGSVYPSPGGKFLSWYSQEDSSWYSLEINTGKRYNLTNGIRFAFWDEQNDVPSLPNAYGAMGWTQDDRYFLVYDHYDIWALDPLVRHAPRRITGAMGRGQQNIFRYIRTDPEELAVPLNSRLLLSVMNDSTRYQGIAALSSLDSDSPEVLLMEPKRFAFRGKARNQETYLWTREDFNEFPDLLKSSAGIKDMNKISNANPEKKSFLWGSVQLVHWRSFDGALLSGLLYLPENLDSTRKYPMIVYFYERNADYLYAWSTPAPSRSIINRPFCVSNGYIVFVPDIVYKTGYPGRSAYDAVISGTQTLTDRFPFIDRDRMGLNGQSWGGYQVAWLVTRTDMFRCAMAGAPVSNMTSAYGGIRWESGMSRMFQYEETQSRIGGTLWDKPLLYLENSPVFSANTIHTPLLIMHNDADGAVPWYQGIELYMAMRRLQKPCWMLSYNKEQHNLTRRADMMDLSIRMMQFYDHFLKDMPEPRWMKAGIPAIYKGKTDAYDLVPE